MKHVVLLFFFSSMSIQSSFGQETPTGEPLYPDGNIPFQTKAPSPDNEKEFPFLYPFDQNVTRKEKDIIFLIIPGGGYTHVAMSHEGWKVAERLNENGYPAYVLRYRIPNSSLMTNKKVVPLQDALQALQTMHQRHPNKKIAVLGFSAGGHLTATLTNFRKEENIGIKTTNLPEISYSILAYPVISMLDSVTHMGSKINLIGPDFSPKDVEYFSMENRVSPSTAPTFIMHAKDDQAVPIENSLRYVASLDKHHVPYQTYYYELGGHGFGLNNKQENGDWLEKILDWIEK